MESCTEYDDLWRIAATPLTVTTISRTVEVCPLHDVAGVAATLVATLMGVGVLVGQCGSLRLRCMCVRARTILQHFIGRTS